MSINYYYFRGSLCDDAECYVKRVADEILFEAVNNGMYCHVLNSSQSGKTSLLNQVAKHLRNNGILVLRVDFSGIGSTTPEENFYKGLVCQLGEPFDPDGEDWWKQNQSGSPAERFKNFVEEILAITQQKIAIFIDEIGGVLDCEFSLNEFFGYMRYFHEKRNNNPEYKRLTFLISGIASLDELSSRLNQNSAVFNIWKTISLPPFKLSDDLEPLKKGLRGIYSDKQIDLITERILYWTGGQPFLTHKLFYLMWKELYPKSVSINNVRDSVDPVVNENIIKNWKEQENSHHFGFIVDRIDKKKDPCNQLEFWLQALEENEITVNNTSDEYQLRLTGLFVKKGDKLKPCCRIYEKIFNKQWVTNKIKKLFPYLKAFNSWIASNMTDKSQLLSGNELQKADEWLKNRNLSKSNKGEILLYIERSKLREEEENLKMLKIQSQLDQEQRDKEAEQERNRKLFKANKKARMRILVATALLVPSVLGFVFQTKLAFQRGETIAEQSETLSNQDLMISNINKILFDELNKHLENGDLKEADELTARIVWEQARTVTEPSLSAEQVQYFPCEVLRDIDKPWTKYTNGKQGLSAQSLIWLDEDKYIAKFVERVEWADVDRTPGKVGITFKNKDSINYSLEHPDGFFPFLVGYTGSDGGRDRTAYLDRIVECGL